MKPLFSIEQDGLSISGTASPDQMKLFIEAKLSVARKVQAKELFDALSAHVSPDLIHQEVLHDVAARLTKGDIVKDRRVAKGIAPENGADGKIVYLARRIKTKGGKLPVRNHKMNLDIENVSVGRALARLYKPKEGTPGLAVTGKALPAKAGRPIELKMNPSLALERADESYDVVVAARDGFVAEEDGTLTVLSELILDGDCEHHFGAIDFCGSISVLGDVKNDCSLTARGGIHVRGGVYSGVILRSLTGPVVVQGTMNGGRSAKVVTAGEFEGNVLQQVDVETHGNIRIKKEAHGCELRTQGYIDARGAHLFGLTGFASLGIEVGKVGNSAGAKTELFLCSEVETQRDYQELVGRIHTHEKALELLELHLGPYAKNAARVVHLDKTHRLRIEALLKKYNEVQGSLRALVTRRDELLATAVLKEDIMLSVEQLLYGGVIVHGGVTEWSSHDEVKGPFSLVLRKGGESFEKIDFVSHLGDTKKKK